MLEFLALAQECAPTVAPQTMAAIARVESNYNPYAIGVVGGQLARQPSNRHEAIATAKALAADNWNFSMGVAQVNRYNLPRYKISYEQAFDACINLRIGSKILEDCFVRASKRRPDAQGALQAAISCYYSGNFTRGFQPDFLGKSSYVQKVLASAQEQTNGIPIVPAIQPNITSLRSIHAPSPPVVVKQQAPADNAPVLLQRANSAEPQQRPVPADQTLNMPALPPAETKNDISNKKKPASANGTVVF